MSRYALGLIVLFAGTASFIQGKSISNKNDRAGAFYYLNKYGYLPKDANKQTAALMSDDAITTAVKEFQVCKEIFQRGFFLQFGSILNCLLPF